MRILEIITPSNIGGAETYFVTTVHRLKALGDEVTVFCPSGRRMSEHLDEQGVRAVSWKTHGKLDLRTLFGLASVIRERHIEIVHTHLSSAAFLGAMAARLAHVPSVATVHGLNTATWYRFPKYLIAVSAAVKEHLTAQGIPPERIHVIHNGIICEHYLPEPVTEAKQRAGFAPETLRAGLIGRLAPEKGQSVALTAWAQVVRTYPTARLMLVGDGKIRAELIAQTAQLGIADSVEFIPFTAPIQPLLSACDVVLAPSLKEGLGLVALEAMALERPVIAADIGGLREVVVDGETGWLTPGGDANALAAALLKLWRDPTQAHRVGEAGRRRVLEKFNATTQLTTLRDTLAQWAKMERKELSGV